MNLYITRHGETEWNTVKRMQGWGNSELTELGVRQAMALRDRLKEIKIDSIFSSPLKRAYETAKIIRGDKKISITKIEGLKEMGFGEWEGRTLEEINADKRYTEQLYNLYNCEDKYIPFNGETILDVKNRIYETLDNIIQNNSDKDILIVTHGMSLKFIIRYFREKADFDIENIIYGQASLTHIEINGDEFKVILNNDTAHYSDDMKSVPFKISSNNN